MSTPPIFPTRALESSGVDGAVPSMLTTSFSPINCRVVGPAAHAGVATTKAAARTSAEAEGRRSLTTRLREDHRFPLARDARSRVRVLLVQRLVLEQRVR